MPDKKPWEKFQSTSTPQQETKKPWERFSEGDEPKVIPTKKKSTSVLSGEQPSGSILSVLPNQESQLPSASSDSNAEAFYFNKANPNAVYKKQGGEWFIDQKKTGKFIPLTQGDVAKRTAYLEKTSEPLEDFDYLKSIEGKWAAEPVKKESLPEEEKSTAQKLFDKKFEVLEKNDPRVKSAEEIDKFSESLRSVAALEEEEAIPLLREKVKGTKYDIFDFQEYGAGDKLRIENKNTGEFIIVDADGSAKNNEVEGKRLQSFIDLQLSFPEYDKLISNRNKLISELDANTRPEHILQEELRKNDEELRVQEARRRGYAISAGKEMSSVLFKKDTGGRGYHSAWNESIGKEISATETRALQLKKQADEFNDYNKWLDNGLKDGSITQEQYAERKNSDQYLAAKNTITTEVNELKKQNSYLQEKAGDMDVIAAQAYLTDKDRGDAASAAIGSFVKGFTSPVDFFLDLKEGRERGGAVDYFQGMSEVLPGEITDDYVNNSELPSWEKALIGISESLGAVASMGPVGELSAAKGVASGSFRQSAWNTVKDLVSLKMSPAEIGLAVNSYSNFHDQIDKDPDFENVPEYEKVLLSATYGLVSGKLEKFGITKAFSKTPVGNNITSAILKNVFSSVPKNASSEVIDAAIETQVKTLIAKGILNATGAALTEGSTEAAQEVMDITLKEAYNEIKGKDYFDTPKSITDAFDQVSESFKLGMIGGSMMGGVSQSLALPSNVRTAGQFSLLEKTISSPEVKGVYVNDLKIKALNGEMTFKQVKEKIQELDEFQKTHRSIPSEVKDKRGAFDLLLEKESLTREIEGKDPDLVAAKKDRIAEINAELQNISRSQDIETGATTNTEPTVTMDERQKTVDAANKVQESFKESGLKVVVHNSSQEYMDTINEFSEDKETDTDRTSARFIPSRNEIHIDLDTADPVSAYHEAFHARVSSMPKPELQKTLQDLKKVVSGNESLMDRVDSFVSQYESTDMTEETLAELSGIMTESALVLDKIKLQKLIEFINNIATKIGLPSVLNKAASRGEAVEFMNGLSRSLREGAAVNSSGATSGKDLARKISRERLNAMNSFDVNYDSLLQEGVDPEVAFQQASDFVVEGIQDDIIREDVIRDLNKRKGIRDKKGPSVDKITGKTPPETITISEPKGLAQIIKREAKAARDKKTQVKEVMKSITDQIKTMSKSGKVTVKQAKAMLNGLRSTNLDSKKSVERYVQYVDKVTKNAEYADKLDAAISMRSKIKRSVTPKKSNPFAFIATGFSQLNPRMVENIDEYLEVANLVSKSLRPTSIRNGEVKFKEEGDIQVIGRYVAKEQAAQNEIALDNLKERYEDVVGSVPGEAMTPSEMREAIDSMSSGEEVNEDVEAKIREQLNDRLQMFNDILIGEDIPVEVREAMNVNPDILDTREVISFLDSLDSYATNGSVSGLKKLVASYKGKRNAKNSTLVAKDLKLAGSKKLGQFNNSFLTNLNIVTERLFRGQNAGLKFRKESGVTGIINGANKAETEQTNKLNDYLKKFAKTPDFDSAENITKRGVLAFLRRDVIESSDNSEFLRRKNLLQESANVLSKGDDKEVQTSEMYQRVFDEIGLTEAQSVEDILPNIGKTNIEAVDYITDMWGDVYNDFSDYALGVHNQLLERDSNYTPDKFSGLEGSTADLSDDLTKGSFSFGLFSNIVLDKKKAGVLMTATRPKSLPKGRYVSLDFDSNMFRAYKLALTDMYTSESVAQTESYMRSPEFTAKVSSKDKKILNSAIEDYVIAMKGKTNPEDASSVIKSVLNTVGSLGAARALARLGQAVNQFSTAMTNTAINAGKFIRMSDIADAKAMNFVNTSGRAIANRGLETVTTIDNINTVKSSKVVSGIRKPFDAITKVNSFMLKYLLSKPDVAAAKISWLAYYRQSMAKQGLPVVLDPNQLNDQAADYAQAMVDRNMDVSDTKLRGSIYRGQKGWQLALKQIFLPFSTFATNQKNRLWSDVSIFRSKTASVEDRQAAGRSFGALLAETAMYNMVRYWTGRVILEAAMEALDLDDEEKKVYVDKYSDNMEKSAWAKAVQDLASPSTLLDNQMLVAANYLMALTGLDEPSEEKVNEYIQEQIESHFDEEGYDMSDEDITKKRETFIEKNSQGFFVDKDGPGLGMLGIQFDRGSEAYDIVKAASTGKYEKEKFGGGGTETHYITKEGQEKLFWPALMKVGAAIALPGEFNQVSDKMFKIVKDKYGLTEKQVEKMGELKDMGFTEDKWMLELIKTPQGAESISETLIYLDGMSEAEKEAAMR